MRKPLKTPKSRTHVVTLVERLIEAAREEHADDAHTATRAARKIEAAKRELLDAIANT